jgi:hypothetical protein
VGLYEEPSERGAHHKNMITLFSLENSADSDIETAMLNTVVYTDTRTSLDDKIQLAIKWNQQNVVDRLLVLKQARLLSLSHPRPQAGASVVPDSPSSSSRRVCCLCLTLVLKQARLLSLPHPRPQAGASVVSVSPSSSSRRVCCLCLTLVLKQARVCCLCLTLVLKQARVCCPCCAGCVCVPHPRPQAGDLPRVLLLVPHRHHLPGGREHGARAGDARALELSLIWVGPRDCVRRSLLPPWVGPRHCVRLSLLPPWVGPREPAPALPSVPRPPFGRPPQVREQVAKTHASSTLALADTFQASYTTLPLLIWCVVWRIKSRSRSPTPSSSPRSPTRRSSATRCAPTCCRCRGPPCRTAPTA